MMNIVRRGKWVYIENSKTDSSGIGFTIDQLDFIILCLQKIQADHAVNNT